ncbi:MAG TPA: hypothetical protein VHZ28_06365 [Terracidiphilus sp.]|jgi:hypothetical protein|nr:hypothetical protein [Terracidiphilus sp.]
MSTEAEEFELMDDESPEGRVLQVLGWFSVGMALAAVGFYVGRELRARYKFKQRTPYDFYSNAGETQAAEFGMGV